MDLNHRYKVNSIKVHVGLCLVDVMLCPPHIFVRRQFGLPFSKTGLDITYPDPQLPAPRG